MSLKSHNLQCKTPGLLGRWDELIINQVSDVPNITFFTVSYRLRALKTLDFYYEKINLNNF